MAARPAARATDDPDDPDDADDADDADQTQAWPLAEHRELFLGIFSSEGSRVPPTCGFSCSGAR
jgi:hypothetical protein